MRNINSTTPHRGSVLIIVLWMSLGLVSLTLMFSHSMYLEFRASDNRLAGEQAQQTIEGVARYLTYLVKNTEEGGALPELTQLQTEGVLVGDSYYWLIGRDNGADNTQTFPVFGLVDEAGKLNLNIVTQEMLEALPFMTVEFSAAIIDWRDEDTELSEYGAESETYSLLDPQYECKNAPFETIEELRLVYGATPEILDGEDTNQNGILDPNENDGELSPPYYDNSDGVLDFGLLEFVTVYSRESNTRIDGSEKVKVTEGEDLTELLTEYFGADRAGEITAGSETTTNLVEYFRTSGMTVQEFDQVDQELSASDDPAFGLININTASRTVLATIPGIGEENVEQLVAYRQANIGNLNSAAWITEVLEDVSLNQAIPFVTGTTYQFTADIAAVGRNGRGYRRSKFVFDVGGEQPEIRHKKYMGRQSWGLGQDIRVQLQNLDRSL